MGRIVLDASTHDPGADEAFLASLENPPGSTPLKKLVASINAMTADMFVNRPPSHTDNASVGYTTGSLWQAGGTIYNAAAYCGIDSAGWQPEYRSAFGGGPVDVMGTTLTRFAGGTVSMLKGYVGAAIDVAVIVNGVYQIATINILSTGELDNVALGAMLSLADANTNCKVLKIYDQTGNGNHAVLATATGIPAVVNATVTTGTTFTVNSVTSGAVAIGQQVFGNGIPPGITIASGTGPYVLSGTGAPTNPSAQAVYLGATSPPYIDWDPTFGRYLIYAPNEGGATASTTNRRALQLPQTMALTNARNVGLYAVGSGISSGDSSCPQLCALGDMTVAPGNTLNIMGSGGGNVAQWGQIQVWSTTVGTRAAALAVVNQPMVLMMATAAGNTAWSVNENTAIGSAVASMPLAGGWVHSVGGSQSSYSMMRLAGFAIFNAAPTAAQSAAMRKAAYSRFNIFPQVLNNVALLGDSRFTSTYVTPQFGVGDLLGKLIGRNWEIMNLAQGGTTTLTQIGDGLVPTVTGVAKSLETFKGPQKNYCFICVGVNDFISNNATVPTVLGYLQTLCAQVAAAKWTPVLISELATSNSSGAANTNLPLLHAAIMEKGAAGMNAAAIVDVSNYVPVMTPGNVAYYYDGLHPAPAVHSILASAIATTLQSLAA